jgi:hypothetical protein
MRRLDGGRAKKRPCVVGGGRGPGSCERARTEDERPSGPGHAVAGTTSARRAVVPGTTSLAGVRTCRRADVPVCRRASLPACQSACVRACGRAGVRAPGDRRPAAADRERSAVRSERAGRGGGQTTATLPRTPAPPLRAGRERRPPHQTGVSPVGGRVSPGRRSSTLEAVAVCRCSPRLLGLRAHGVRPGFWPRPPRPGGSTRPLWRASPRRRCPGASSPRWTVAPAESRARRAGGGVGA